MTDARFSVVIPLFNKRAFIRQTLESALAQDRPAAEIIVVDNGSTDGSLDEVADLLAGPATLISAPHEGPGAARNRGIEAARSEWIAFLDADDLWFPDHLATLANVVDSFPQADVVASGFRRSPVQRFGGRPASSTSSVRMIDYFDEAQRGEPLWTSCVAVRRETAIALGGFGEFWPGEDLDFWARLALDHRIAVSDRETALYITGTGGLMEQSQRQPGRFELQPIFATLQQALADPLRANRHCVIASYRDSLLRQGARQALYRGDRASARASLRLLHDSSGMRVFALRALAQIPGPMMRVGSRAYSRVKRWLAGPL